jgi:hypothetical protein
MALKGKLIKFVDNCTGLETSQNYMNGDAQVMLFGVDYHIRTGDTGIVLEEQYISSIGETFINVLIGDRVINDIRLMGNAGYSRVEVV